MYSVEIVPDLHELSSQRMDELGYDNVSLRLGDGYLGWEEEAPFDAILVTAAPDEVPAPLIEQLAPSGVLVVPVGPQSATQQLMRIRKAADGESVSEESVIPVRFVPLVRRNP